MKKALMLILVLALCFGVAACSFNAPAARPEGSSAPAESVPEQTGPTEETVFDITTEPTEEGLFKEVVRSPYSEATLYSDGIFGQIVWRHEAYPDGTHRYENYHENGFPCITAYVDAEGNCTQTHHLDNGYRGDDGPHLGTVIYRKTQSADGNTEEYFYDEQGVITSSRGTAADGSSWENAYSKEGVCICSVSTGADGSHAQFQYYENGNLQSSSETQADGICREIQCYENGEPKFFREELADGSYSQTEHLEDGTCIRSVSSDESNKVYSETENYAGGSRKYSKHATADSTLEQKWDEKGFCTYYFYSDSAGFFEAVADESGKLVKVTENGTVYEDPRFLADIAATYNFAS